MGSIELSERERRARYHYELVRARRAVVGFAPALVVVALAALVNERASSAVLFGSLLFVLGASLLWYGRDLRRAVLPGLGVGLFPLVCALCANRFDHACVGGSCTSLCVPACALSGLAAGIGLALLGRDQPSRFRFWLASSALVLSTGAMGCACVGYAGVAGLVAGYATGLLPMLLLSARPR